MIKEFVLEKFQGPLDLLLNLIDDAKLAITEISLGQVTEQFFGHLDKFGDDRTDELADFLVVGTKLVYLKSRELLPYLYPEEDEGPGLAEQLKLYKKYADASKQLERFWNRHQVGYLHLETPPKIEGFFPPANATTQNLKKSFELILKRLTPVAPLPQVKIDHTVSVKQKVHSLYETIKKLERLTFKDLVGQAANRSDVIVSFLALLELLKQTKISIQQDQGAFGEMVIEHV